MENQPIAQSGRGTVNAPITRFCMVMIIITTSMAALRPFGTAAQNSALIGSISETQLLVRPVSSIARTRTAMTRSVAIPSTLVALGRPHDTRAASGLFRCCLKRSQSRDGGGGGRVRDVQKERRDERGDQTEQGQPVQPAGVAARQILH